MVSWVETLMLSRVVALSGGEQLVGALSPVNHKGLHQGLVSRAVMQSDSEVGGNTEVTLTDGEQCGSSE